MTPVDPRIARTAFTLAAALVGGSCHGGGAGVSDAGLDARASGSGGGEASADADADANANADADANMGIGGGGGGAAGAPGGGDPNAWANWPMPNPVATALPNPQSYDTATSGVVVRDRVTGLTWERSVDLGGRLWADAGAYCDGLSLDGHDDWRLPTLIELVSLVDFTQQNPSIDATAFPATPADSFWTSSPVVGSPGDFWYVQFTTGFNYPGHSDFLPIKVRCVR